MRFRDILMASSIGGGSGWTPYSLSPSSQGLWWDALPSTWRSNGGITVATGVSSWRDNFLGRDATQGTGSLQPALAAAGLGYNCPIGDGLDDTLNFASTGLPSGAAEGDLYVLCRQDALVADATRRYVTAYGDFDGANRRSAERIVATGVNRAETVTGDGTTKLAVNTTVDLSGWHLVRARFRATTTYLSVDGGSESNVAAVPVTINTRGRLFASNNTAAGNFWAGAIASVFWSFAALTDAETDLITTYFMSRKGS